MQLSCPHCHAVLEFTAKPPSFCGYCGKSLSRLAEVNPATATEAAPKGPASAPTIDFDSEGATVPPPTTQAAPETGDPERVGGYRLLRPLGIGGMGTVYEAEEIASGRHVAVKLVSAQYAASRDAVERFRREGRLASALAHPRCVYVLAVDEEAGRPYIVMELMSGATLQDLVKERGPLPVEEAVTKILDVVDGLQEAHQLGVIHRDMKPSNCFLEDNGRVKVGDFGLAKSLVGDTNLTKTGSFMGTALYASPEQIRADPVNEQTDLYSVAATLYFLLTGKAPYQTGDAAATMARIVSDPAPSMRTLRPELPAALDRVVLRGLERSRDRRWRDLGEFRAALRPFLPGQQTAGSLGPRFAAHLLDWIIVTAAIVLGIFPYVSWQIDRTGEVPKFSVWVLVLVSEFVWFLYLLLFEGLGDASPGKRIMRLRVSRAGSGDTPGFLRALVRTGTWFLFIPAPWLACDLLFTFKVLQFSWFPFPLLAFQWFMRLVSRLSGTALLLLPMRRGNGWRCLHDWLSDTRVLRVVDEENQWPLSAASRRAGLTTNLGRRLAAQLVDLVWAVPLYLLSGSLTREWLGGAASGWQQMAIEYAALTYVGLLAIYTLLEGLWGCSPGKWLMRLRVCGSEGTVAPGLPRGLARTAVFLLLGLVVEVPFKIAGTALGDEGEFLWGFGAPLLQALLYTCTMRSRNGWRGPHELLSGTRTVVLPWWGTRQRLRDGQLQRLEQSLTHPADLPKVVGPFSIRGALQWTPADKVLLAEDEALNRKVCIQLRPCADGPVEEGRRGVNRPTRMRWLGSGIQGEWHWDAFACPSGCPLGDVVSRRAPLTWAEARPLLRQLAEELAAACADGTLPKVLTTDQVWVQGTGHVQLLGTALGKSTTTMRPPAGAPDQDRALALLGETAILALEGQPRPDAENGQLIQAPLPGHASVLVARLLKVDKPFPTIENARVELAATEQRPACVTWRTRAMHLVLLGVLLLPAWLLWLVFVAGSLIARGISQAFTLPTLTIVCAIPCFWVLWAFLTRGGFSSQILGLALVRHDGRPVHRWQCAWRAFLVWAPFPALVLACIWFSSRLGEAELDDLQPEALAIGLAMLGSLTLFMVFAGMALLMPSRTLHDRLAGTYLVPK